MPQRSNEIGEGRMNNRRCPLLFSTIAVLCIGIIGSPAWAQSSSEGSLRGRVVDTTGAVLPGVNVRLSATGGGFRQLSVTDESGIYRLGGIPPGTYDLIAELSGFTTAGVSSVSIRAGVNATLDVTLSIAGVQESVEVRRNPPLLESETALRALNLDGDVQRSLPLSSRRAWSDALFITPGVVMKESGGGVRHVFQVHGSDIDSNVMHLDGADIGPATQALQYLTNFSDSTIEDVQVKTAAVDASTPLGLGVVMNVAAKRGSNRISGQFSITLQPSTWIANNVPGGTATREELVLLDLAGGGPLRRDRWWYFRVRPSAGLRCGREVRTAADIENLRVLAPEFEPRDAATDGTFYFAKVTGQPWVNHHVAGFYQRDKHFIETFGARSVDPSLSQRGGDALSLRLDSVLGARLLARVGVCPTTSRFTLRSPTRVLRSARSFGRSRYRADVPQEPLR